MVTEQTISLCSAFYGVLNHRVNLLSCFMAQNRKTAEAQMVERVKVKHGKEKKKAAGADKCQSYVPTFKTTCFLAGLCVYVCVCVCVCVCVNVYDQ